jgi:very-short-patch-repair endonuclease
MEVTGTRLYDPPRNGEGDRAKRGGGGPRILQSPIKRVKRARDLRKTMSLPEVLLWQQLRKRPDGLKFRKQFPVGEMTVDFACLDRRLLIEVDGEGHNFGEQPRRDVARDAILRRDGFKIMRIAAHDVLHDLDAVLRWIVATCLEVGPLHQPVAGPPPRSGEDLP